MKGFLKRLAGVLLLIATAPIIFIGQPISWLISGKTSSFLNKYMNWIDNELLEL